MATIADLTKLYKDVGGRLKAATVYSAAPDAALMQSFTEARSAIALLKVSEEKSKATVEAAKAANSPEYKALYAAQDQFATVYDAFSNNYNKIRSEQQTREEDARTAAAAKQGDEAGKTMENATRNAGNATGKWLKGVGNWFGEKFDALKGWISGDGKTSAAEPDKNLTAEQKKAKEAKEAQEKADKEKAEKEKKEKEEKAGQSGGGFFDKLDVGGMLGGLGGGIMGWMLGNIFGDGIIGKIVGGLLALGMSLLGYSAFGPTINKWMGKGPKETNLPQGNGQQQVVQHTVQVAASAGYQGVQNGAEQPHVGGNRRNHSHVSEQVQSPQVQSPQVAAIWDAYERNRMAGGASSEPASGVTYQETTNCPCAQLPQGRIHAPSIRSHRRY